MNRQSAPLYESDFYRWTQHQADMLRSGNLAALDIDNLLEEVETMGRGERRGLESRLTGLLMHLLKWVCQPTHQGRSWMLTIKEQRIQVRRLLKENPSLGHNMAQTIEDIWEIAKIKAEKETGIDPDRFPEHCPWGLDDILDDGFWPD